MQSLKTASVRLAAAPANPVETEGPEDRPSRRCLRI
jgi:hypothetical protein